MAVTPLSPNLSSLQQQQLHSANLVAEHLKSPDDLTKIPALRKKLAKEHASLEAKLKSGAKDQLEATRDGLLKLQATRKDVAAVREAFTQIDRLNQEAQNQGEDVLTPQSGRRSGSGDAGSRTFKIISEVSQIHRNFVQTAATLDKLAQLPLHVDSLSQLLAESHHDLYGPAPHLLPLHLQLSALEQFRNETLQLGRACSSDVRATLADLFEPFDHLVKEFESYLFSLGERVLELVREGQGGVVVRLLKIVEKECREDEKAAAVRLAKKANLEGAARFRSVIANARVIKLYRPKLLSAMDTATKDLFEECWGRFGQTGDAFEFLEHLDWVYKDLATVRDEMVPLFPPDYDIYRLVVRMYQKHLGNILQQRILATEPEAAALLTLYQFTQEYKQTLTKELSVDPKWLEPSLLAGKEQGIIDDYLGLITRKIDEWTANIMSDEVRAFVARQEPPEEDGDGLYGLQGAVDLFQMVNQQVDRAADSGQASVLARSVGHACTAMRTIQATWLRVLEREFKKQREAKTPDDVVGGLVEYVIALANDNLKSADYAEALQTRLEPLVSEKYKKQIKEAVEAAINGFLDVSKRSTQVLVDVVFSDLKPAIKDLFTYPIWYAEGTTTTIVETIRDYMSDYAERLNPNLFENLCNDVMDRFLISYIGALRRCTKLRMPAAADRMRADIDDAQSMFCSFKNEDGVAEKMEVLHMIVNLVTSSSTMVFLTYWTFAKTHGAQLSFLDSLMRARDDLDKADVSAIMESARRKVKQENVPEIPRDGPTVMTRVAQAHASGLGAGILAGFGVGGMAREGDSELSGPKWAAGLAQSAQNYLGQQWKGAGKTS